MLAWLSQNIGTIIVCAILITVFALLIRSLIRDKKKGKSLCGGNCGACAMGCHCHSTESNASAEGSSSESGDTPPLKGGDTP